MRALNRPAPGAMIEPEETEEDAPIQQMEPPRSPWRMSRHSFICLCGGALSGIILLAAFCMIGSDPLVASLLCAAWTVGWAAMAVGGGFQTVTGWFAFFPLFHFLLFSLPFKVVFWDAADQGLRAPVSTSLVMLLFFTGLLLATLVCRIRKIGTRPMCIASENPNYYRALAWICWVLGTMAFFITILSQSGDAGDSDSGGGGMGILNLLVSFQDFSIAAYVYYAWKADLTLWKRPVFWLFFLSGIFLGILTSAKGATSQPIVYLLLGIATINGLRSAKLLAGFAIFGALLSSFIYPVMHYARGLEGARTGGLMERIEIMESVTVKYITDSSARSDINEQVDDYANSVAATYLPQSAGVFDRFVMIGPTDLLVAGVDQSGAADKYHGFELFKLGLQLLAPKALYADKPDIGSSEFLADVAGTRNANGHTYPTWGLPGELYYSFGFPGVLLGAFVIETLFFLIINFWFGSQVKKSVWFCLTIVALNMTNSTAAIDSIPLFLLGLCLPSLGISKMASLFSRRSNHAYAE